MKKIASNKDKVLLKSRRGRPPKVKSEVVQVEKKRRGRPPKVKSEVIQVEKKRRGRPPKIAAPTEVIKPVKIKVPVEKPASLQTPKTPEQNVSAKIEKHPLYASAQWIQEHVNPAEEAYLKRRANKQHINLTYTILDHMLGYFSIQDGELTAALKEIKKIHSHD